MSEDMGFTIPFETAVESTNVFVKNDTEYTELVLLLYHGTLQQCHLKSGKILLDLLLQHMQQDLAPGMMLRVRLLTTGQQRRHFPNNE